MALLPDKLDMTGMIKSTTIGTGYDGQHGLYVPKHILVSLLRSLGGSYTMDEYDLDDVNMASDLPEVEMYAQDNPRKFIIRLR